MTIEWPRLQVNLDYEDRIKISEICSELDVDGLRGDMVTNRAAKALAAFEGRTQVCLRPGVGARLRRLLACLAA